MSNRPHHFKPFSLRNSLRNLCVLCVSAVNGRNRSYRRVAEGAEVAQRVGHWQSFFLSYVGVALIGVSLAGLMFLLPGTQASEFSETTVQQQQQMQFPETLDYSKYSHSSQYHARLPCLLCHRRETNASQPNLPGGNGHLPCKGCHVQQFAASGGPICSVCHTDSRSGALKSFPKMRSFQVKFDHSLHSRMPGAGCNTCHRPSRGGVALSIPATFNAHNTCFQCHTPQAKSGDRDISSCSVCHQLGSYSRTPEFAQAFRVNFNHSEHRQMRCNECHQVRAGMPQRRQVTAPQPLNHHATGRSQSCKTCHDGKRAFGGDDFSVCNRCHTGAAWRF